MTTKLLTIVCTGLAVFLTACSGNAEEVAGDGPAADTAVESGRTMVDGAGDRPMNMIESFSFSQSGDVETLHEFALDDLSITGGCLENEGIGLIFMDMKKARQPTGFLLSIEDDTSPAPGETGTFPIAKVTWSNGNVPHPELDGILVPNTFEGPGELTITQHIGGGMNGRMVARVTGDLVQSESGDAAQITANFDIYWGCKG